mgnify:CR=1 FL=1
MNLTKKEQRGLILRSYFVSSEYTHTYISHGFHRENENVSREDFSEYKDENDKFEEWLRENSIPARSTENVGWFIDENDSYCEISSKRVFLAERKNLADDERKSIKPYRRVAKVLVTPKSRGISRELTDVLESFGYLNCDDPRIKTLAEKHNLF